MKLFYCLSVLILFITFLMYKKSNKILNLISWFIYSVCLLFCYNTVIVSIISFFNLGGNLLIYSFINYLVSIFFVVLIIKTREHQKYKLNKNELILSLIIILVVVLIGYFRFDGLNSISYQSGDSAVHFQHAKFFSRELTLLNESNSKDRMYGAFNKVMPISYVNAGFLINLLSEFKSYKVFICYDVFCFLMYALLFLVTLFKIFERRKNSYIYMLIVTLLYTLGFPLNNLLFGFCYMGLGIMVVNLLFLSILYINDNFNKNICLNLIGLFIINFSLFFSYYLYVPPVYLTLGIYYIYLWKKKKINTKNLFLYCIITLIVPFFIGFIYFILPSFLDNDAGNIFTYINMWGYIYDNNSPICMLPSLVIYLVYDNFVNKIKIDYFYLIFYILTAYIILFTFLYMFNLSEIYYFYKLFYLYWIFLIVLLAKKLVNKRIFLYILASLIIVSICYITIFPDVKFSNFISKLNVYNYNAKILGIHKERFDKEEIEIMEESIKHKDICVHNDEFIIIGSHLKPRWYYAVTDIIPVFNHSQVDSYSLDGLTISFNTWNYLDEYKCVIYFYEDDKVDYNISDYDILFENEAGAILKKK